MTTAGTPGAEGDEDAPMVGAVPAVAAADVSVPSQRIGDRERDGVVALLQRALADGRLTVAELNGRLTVALNARTQAELAPLTADLADGTLPDAPTAAELVTQPPGPPGYSRRDPLLLDGGDRRSGVWTVPPFIRIDHESRWLRLDFQRAVTRSSIIDIEVIGGAGWILLVVPIGWAADVDRLSTGWGSRSVKVPKEPVPGAPLLVVHGAVGAGRLRIRTPSRRDRRREAQRAP